jgi:hypothetical protein
VPGRDGEKGERGEKGLDGIHGKDGRDGTLEHLAFEQLDDRQGRFVRADGSEVGRVKFTLPLYCGVFVEGTTYAKGDVVTWAGSAWIARDTTTDKPGTGATAWQLCVKAGRDGREGKQGPEGPKGSKGDPGAPGRDR